MATQIAQPGKPIKEEMEVYRNDTLVKTWKFEDEGGNAVNLNGSSFKLEVRRTPYDETPILTVTDSSFTLSQDSDGVAAGAMNLLELEHTETDMDIPEGTYQYDLQQTLPSGRVQTILQGKFKVKNDITK